MGERGGPYLSVAAICECVNQKDDVASVIRIVDRFTFSTPPDAPEEIGLAVEATMSQVQLGKLPRPCYIEG